MPKWRGDLMRVRGMRTTSSPQARIPIPMPFTALEMHSSRPEVGFSTRPVPPMNTPKASPAAPPAWYPTKGSLTTPVQVCKAQRRCTHNLCSTNPVPTTGVQLLYMLSNAQTYQLPALFQTEIDVSNVTCCLSAKCFCRKRALCQTVYHKLIVSSTKGSLMLAVPT